MQSAALAANWLEPINGTVTNANWNPNTITCVPTLAGNYWPTSWCYHYDGPAKPIKLTFAEVERLRQAAKRDAKLKAILTKFTEQIELVVDFE